MPNHTMFRHHPSNPSKQVTSQTQIYCRQAGVREFSRRYIAGCGFASKHRTLQVSRTTHATCGVVCQTRFTRWGQKAQHVLPAPSLFLLEGRVVLPPRAPNQPCFVNLFECAYLRRAPADHWQVAALLHATTPGEGENGGSRGGGGRLEERDRHMLWLGMVSAGCEIRQHRHGTWRCKY